MTRTSKLTLITISIITAGLRFGTLSHGLPWLPQQDEFQIVERTLAMGKGLPDPGLYTWPAGPVFYINLIAFGTTYLNGLLTGVFSNSADFANWYLADPTWLYLASRGLSAVWGVLAILLTFNIGKYLSGSRAGLIAALAVALTPEWLQASTVTLPDAFAAAIVAASLALFIKATRRASTRYYLWACLAGGLAIAGKYHTWSVIFPLMLTSVWLPPGRRVRYLIWGVGILIAAFTITNPFAVMQPEKLADSLALMSFRLYVTAWSFFRYDWMISVGLGFALGLPLLLMSGLGTLRAITRHNRVDLILLTFLIPFLMIVGFRRAPPKFLLPALIPMLALGGAAISDLSKLFTHRRSSLAILSILIFACPIYRVAVWLGDHLQEDNRYAAARVALGNLGSQDLVIVDEMPPDPLIIPLAPDKPSLAEHAAKKAGAGGWTKARLEAGDYPFGRTAVAMKATEFTPEGFYRALSDPRAKIMILCDLDTPLWRAEENLEPGMSVYEREKQYRELVRHTARERGWQSLYHRDPQLEGNYPGVEVWLIHE